MKKIFFIIVYLCTSSISSQSNEQWKLKVSDMVFEQFSNEQNIEYLIQIKEKPDLSLAKTFSDFNEKKEYVYNLLKSFSNKSQELIINSIKANDLEYKQFFITNAILVKSDYNFMSKIAKLNNVKYISANPSIKNDMEVTLDKVNYRNPNGIEWGIIKINANDVWDLGYTGSGVVIGGQDTGYRWTHEAIKSQYRGWDGNVANHNFNWHDAIHEININNTGDNPCGLSITEPCDDYGHGTHTMGTMIGENGSNQIGVAPDAKWIGCRNMERGWGTPSTYLECFEWFLAPTDLNGENANTELAPDIINNSWHCTEDEGCDNSNYVFMENAINNLRSAGIVVVSSAGNSGPNCNKINSPPGFFNSSFTVGASNSLDTIAGFSSRGPTTGYGNNLLKPNIVAPGVMVRSSTYDSDNSYGIKSGTSMAAPHVTGAIALLIDAFPSLKGHPEDIESVLEQSALYLDTDQSCNGINGTEIPNNTYGYGRLDILEAINYKISMPLKLFRFYHKKIGIDIVKLIWEIEGIDFEIVELQRSTTGFSWEKIFESDFEDSYVDNNPAKGQNFYRLKLYYSNGDFIYSKVISFQNDVKIQFSHYPTIVKKSSNINIIISGEKGKDLKINIFDCYGRQIIEKLIYIDCNSKEISFPLKNTIPGVYHSIITDNNSGCNLVNGKFIVQ